MVIVGFSQVSDDHGEDFRYLNLLLKLKLSAVHLMHILQIFWFLYMDAECPMIGLIGYDGRMEVLIYPYFFLHF